MGKTKHFSLSNMILIQNSLRIFSRSHSLNSDTQLTQTQRGMYIATGFKNKHSAVLCVCCIHALDSPENESLNQIRISFSISFLPERQCKRLSTNKLIRISESWSVFRYIRIQVSITTFQQSA